MKLKYILTLIVITIYGYADVMDRINISYEKVKIKQKSKKKSKRNGCYMYVDINGNADWHAKKDELNTIIERGNKCRKITIYKSISNVNVRRGNSDNESFDINIGAIIKKTKYINIETITVVNNSNISGGYLNSNSNVGNVIQVSKGSSIQMNNVKMSTKIEIKNSTLGSNPLMDIGMDTMISNLSDMGQ